MLEADVREIKLRVVSKFTPSVTKKTKQTMVFSFASPFPSKFKKGELLD